MVLVLAFASLCLAFLAAGLFVRNLFLYRVPGRGDATNTPKISILIPARNEEGSIGQAIESALRSRDVEVEVIVLDDHSEDRTAEIVGEIRRRDGRVRLASAPPLPPGWCGKQFACSRLSELASHQILCFIDSDVRLQPDGLVRMAGFLERSRCGLVSGFPQQEVETFFERLLLPMMHFLLLSFLPIDLMRRIPAPSLGAGCGQIFLVDRKAYLKAGGHASIRSSRHDGISLPRAFRRAHIQTDICDATDVACCRMYRNGPEVFRGLLKNANEGIATPIGIFVFTALLGGGHVIPFALVAWCLVSAQFGFPFLLSLTGSGLSLLPRLLAAIRFRQPVAEALLHPVGILVLLGLQWYARYRDLTGIPAVWKGRSYQTT